MNYEVQPFGWTEDPATPKLEEGRGGIKLVVNRIGRTGRRVDLEFHAAYMFSDRVAERFRDLDSALVFVLTDVDQRDGFALRVENSRFVKYAPGYGPPADNLKALPPLPLAPRGDPSLGDSSTGGYINGALWFESAHPIHRPSVFLYLVMENFVSNTVGLDLVGQRAITY
jgi:hypothetical protein